MGAGEKCGEAGNCLPWIWVLYLRSMFYPESIIVGAAEFTELPYSHDAVGRYVIEDHRTLQAHEHFYSAVLGPPFIPDFNRRTTEGKGKMLACAARMTRSARNALEFITP